jgi:hypothetical protein
VRAAWNPRTLPIAHSEMAKHYESEDWQMKLRDQLTAFLQSNLPFIGADRQGGVSLLEYVCLADNTED